MPTVTIYSETVLHCTEGASDKLYKVCIEDEGGAYSVHCFNCRRGAAYVDQGYKCQGVGLPAAEKKAAAVIKSKLDKGYYLYSERSGGTATASVKAAAPVAAPTALSSRTSERRNPHCVVVPPWRHEDHR